MFYSASGTAAGSRRHLLIIGLLITALMALGVQQAPPAFAVPLAAKIAPAVTPVGVGVTISGAELNSATGVTFLGADGPADDVAAAHFIVLDAKKVVAQVPAGAVSGPVRVDTPDGPTTTPVSVTIVPPPVITSLSVTAAAAGETVTITGENLTGSKKPKVLFGAKGAKALRMTPTELDVAVPGIAGGPVSLTVITDGGTVEAAFYVAPTLKAITPKLGTTAGGTVATITGSGLTGVDNFTDDPATPAVNEAFDGVTIGGARVTGLLAVSDKEVVVATPPGTDPAAPVVVRTRASWGSIVATSQGAVAFQYRPSVDVTAVSPDWNTLDNPQPITVTGTNLTDATQVLVNGVAPNDVVVDATAGTMTFTPPPAAKAGVAKMAFTNLDNGIPLTTVVAFSYVAAPTVAKVAPMTAPAGSMITVGGTNFASNTTVTFGNATASCTVLSIAEMLCKAPTGAGVVEVTATNSAGSSVPVAGKTTFTYGDGTPPAFVNKLAPAVGGLAPAYGAPGSTVALKGANLHTATKVEFTGADDTWVEAPTYLRVAPGRLVVKVPPGTTTGELRVTNPNGRIETKMRLTRVAMPAVTSIDVVGDATVAVTPNDLLKVRGKGLFIKGAKTLVTIGGKPAPILSRPKPKPNLIVVKVPADVGGRREVVVSTPLGSATAELSAYYVPDVKAVKPATNSRDGGVIATITGTGFTGADDVTIGAGRRQAVTFRGLAVQKWVFLSDKAIIAVTAPRSATADDLVVTTQHDGRVGNSDDVVASVNAPVPYLSGVTPATGPVSAQGSVVTLTGQNLGMSTEVKFGSSTATVQSAAPDGTSINVIPPIRVTTGSVPITLTNIDDGQPLTATFPASYTYVLTPAVIDAMSVSTGVPGTVVTITGTSFVDVTSVRFGTVAATFSVANHTTIFATVPATPAGAAGSTVNVTVTNTTGQPSSTSPATQWTWDASPMITGLSQSTGPSGTTVTISGSNFVGVTDVMFGDFAPTSWTYVNANTITAVVPNTPAGLGGATVNVRVFVGTALSQAATPTADDWTWMAPAVITSMSHNTAPAGTVVTVTGVRFAHVRSVVIHNLAVSYTVTSPTTLTFVAPAGTGSGPTAVGSTRNVVITNGSGLVSTADPTNAAAWTFQ